VVPTSAKYVSERQGKKMGKEASKYTRNHPINLQDLRESIEKQETSVNKNSLRRYEEFQRSR